jgi:hypothetical protein
VRRGAQRQPLRGRRRGAQPGARGSRRTGPAAPRPRASTPRRPRRRLLPIVWLQEGALAFYRGWLPSVIGVIPYVGLNFGVYETLKASLLTHYGLRDERELSVRGFFQSGGGCGVLGRGRGPRDARGWP